MASERFSIKNILLVLLVIIIAYLMYKIVDIMLILFASYVLACSFNPIVDKLEQKMPRNVATGLVCFDYRDKRNVWIFKGFA